MIDCQTLLNLPIAKDLTADDCVILAKIANVKQLNDQENLFRAGDTTNTLYVILKGKLDVLKEDPTHEALNIHTLHKGDMAGEMSFIDGEEHSVTLRAQGAAELLCIENEAFVSLLLSHPHIVYHVMRAITRSTHNALRRMNAQFVDMNRFINNEYM